MTRNVSCVKLERILFFSESRTKPLYYKEQAEQNCFGCCVRKKIRIEWMGQAWYMLPTPSPSSMATYCTSSPTCLTIFPLLSSLQPVCQTPVPTPLATLFSGLLSLPTSVAPANISVLYITPFHSWPSWCLPFLPLGHNASSSCFFPNHKNSCLKQCV